MELIVGIEVLTDPFKYEFMIRALIAAILSVKQEKNNMINPQH